MSAKKGRGAKVLKVQQDDNQIHKGSSLNSVDSPDLSAIERVSFLEGLQLNYGNPLHSTAMEEDLNVLEEGQMKKDTPPTLKTAVKQRGTAVKRKETERDDDNEMVEETMKRNRRSVGHEVKVRPEKKGETKKRDGTPPEEKGELDVEREESEPRNMLLKGNQPTPTVSRLKQLVGKKPAKKRSAGQLSAARPVKNQQMKTGKRRERESASGKSSEPQSQEDSDTGTVQQRRMNILPSDEDEDTSWNPSPKKAKGFSFDRRRKSSFDRSKSRKSSSGSASAGAGEVNSDKQRRKRRGGQGATELEVVLDAFLHFCDQYRESVESKAVRQSIDSFSSNVREQLLEKVSTYKELRVLKRENTKVGSLIRTKTQRLLDAKYELMRAEKQARLLQKEKTELELRLSDLRQGQAFLRDIRELNRQYLDFRHKHPREKETYGASSLPALLLETKHIQSTEHQLRGINNRLEKRLQKSGTLK